MITSIELIFFENALIKKQNLNSIKNINYNVFKINTNQLLIAHFSLSYEKNERFYFVIEFPNDTNTHGRKKTNKNEDNIRHELNRRYEVLYDDI